jgi:hypothetical protein
LTINVVQIKIYANPNDPNPTQTLLDVPWFAGITALQAMIIGDAAECARNILTEQVERSGGTFANAKCGAM